MTFPRLRLGLLGVFAVLGLALKGQPVLPPYQDYVAALGRERILAWNVTGLNPGRTFTLETWVYLSRTSDSGWIAGKGHLESNSSFFLSYALVLTAGSRPSFVHTVDASMAPVFVTAPAALPLRQWTHLAAVMDGPETRLFVDGELVTSGRATGPPRELRELPFSVGSSIKPAGTENFLPVPGYARQLRFWSVARTATQIRSALGESRPTDSTGLMAYWPLDDFPGSTTAREASGAGQSLSLGGFVPTSAALLAAGPFFAFGPTTGTSYADGAASRAVAIDFDSDGDLDLVILGSDLVGSPAEFRPALRAYRNEKGVFSDATSAVFGGAALRYAVQAIAADFNSDGRTDLLIIGRGSFQPPYPGEQARLFLQTPDGRLEDASHKLPQRLTAVLHCAVSDVDGDGDLDIFLGADVAGNLSPCIYLNDGTGNFTRATDRIPASLLDRAATDVASLLVDINGDSRPDLIIGGSVGPDELLINDGRGYFSASSRWVLPPRPPFTNWSTNHIAAGDFDGDGRNDLAFTGWGSNTPRLQVILNSASGPMRDAATGVGWAVGEYAADQLSVVDFNRDGRPDIIARSDAAGRYTLRLLINQGPGHPELFTDASAALPFYQLARYAAADFDHDGITDLLVSNFTGFAVAYAQKPMVFGRLANVSVRTQAGTGDQTLITGFALGGSGTKPLLVRAVGPALGTFGLTGTLTDPFVEIAPLGGAKLTENNDWGGTAALKSAFASVGAFPLSPDTSKDAALAFSPGAGAYTAKVTGANNGTGMALIEVYALSDLPSPNSNLPSSTAPRLTNLSARTLVGPGAEALIVGFVVDGTLPKRLLIRAAGPTLGAFGVGGTLADPVLTLRALGSETVIAANDDWAGTAALKSAFASVSAFAFPSETSLDSALAIELPPGAYTATVSGKQNTTGVALVEVYELP